MTVFNFRSSEFILIARYYLTGIVNMLFGISVYSILIWFGVNMYLAQLLAQIFGVTFNYFSYKRNVFNASSPAKLRFILSYVFSYFVALLIFSLVARFITSPYAVGIATAFIMSALNFMILKKLVFRVSRV